MSCSRFRINANGVTLVELLIVIVVSTAITAVVLSFALTFWSSNATLQNDLETYVARSNAGDTLRDYLNASSGLINQNNILDNNPAVPDATDASGQHWAVINAIPKSIPVGSSGNMTPVFYFEAPAQTKAKVLIMNGTQPYDNEFMLYLNGTTKELLLRSLANGGASNNSTKTSCPAALASASCPADKLVADNVSSVDVRYFSRSGNTIDFTSITDPNTGQYAGPDFPSVEVVEVTIHLSKKSTLGGGENTSNSTIIRVAIRNR